jgi:hypothetical protein
MGENSQIVDLTTVHLNWCIDILKRMKYTIESGMSESEKLEAMQYLVKQALKVEREE